MKATCEHCKKTKEFSDTKIAELKKAQAVLRTMGSRVSLLSMIERDMNCCNSPYILSYTITEEVKMDKKDPAKDHRKVKVDVKIIGVVDYSQDHLEDCFGPGLGPGLRKAKKDEVCDVINQMIAEADKKGEEFTPAHLIVGLCSKFTGVQLLYALFHAGELKQQQTCRGCGEEGPRGFFIPIKASTLFDLLKEKGVRGG